ncbi:MAG: hypothetical protein ACO2O4_04890 [Minisyncoccia bacterium]|jgi:hypothetical protein
MKLFHFSDRLNIAEEIRLYSALEIYYENYRKYFSKFSKRLYMVQEVFKFYENLFILGNSRYERIILSSIYRNNEIADEEFFVRSYLKSEFRISEGEFISTLIKGIDGIKEIVEYLGNLKIKYELDDNLKNILLRPVSEEFINFLTLCFRYGKDLFEIIGYPYIVEKPTIKFAITLIQSIEDYHSSQGIYRPHDDYHPSRLSDEMKIFIAWWRRFLLYDYGIVTGEVVIFYPEKASRLPLGESIVEKLGGLEMPKLLGGDPNPMPKYYILKFVEKIESIQGGEAYA